MKKKKTMFMHFVATGLAIAISCFVADDSGVTVANAQQNLLDENTIHMDACEVAFAKEDRYI